MIGIMAKLVITDQTLIVALSISDKLHTLQRNLKVPRWAILGVRAVADGLDEARGVLGSGTEVPGVLRAGTIAYQGTVTFAICRVRVPAVVIELSGQAFDRLILTVADPDAVVAQLA
jgi:hypothetical protein